MDAELVQFAGFELDRAAYQLRHKGRVVHLERIPLEVMLLLVERRGQLVTREEIRKRIWGEDVFLDIEASINTAIRKLRRALRDRPSSPRFIETVAAKGYRFVAAVCEPAPKIVPIGQSESALADHGPKTIPPIDSQRGERRHLTVLVCELVHLATPMAQPDPEEWWENVADYHRAARDSIERYGGHVGPYRGDAMMVYFGWPTAHDNDAERAVLAALAIIEAVAKLNERLPGPKLSPRIGIDSGAVILVANPDHNVDFFGDTPSIAVDLQRAALPDTVLMTDATHRLVPGLFVVEDCGACLRNRTELPVQVYRAIRSSGARGRLEAVAAAHGLTPFVGREDELRLLTNRWERTLEGEGHAILIIGEPGVGKSRLVQHFHQQIVRTRHIWAETAAGPFFQNTPFYPVSELLRQFLAVTPDESPADQVAQLESALRLCGLKPAEAVPLIAPMLNLSVPEKYPPLVYSADRQRRRLLATLAELVRSASQIQPLVIVLEDLHWADPSTLELLQLLVEQRATARLLLLHTGRPEFRPEWALRAHDVHITLSRLSERDARTMINQVALNESLSEETVLALVERTGGVPLFIEELTRAVLESGHQNVNREIPATLYNSLLARLDRLDWAKEVAQVASVIGREFSYELLHAVHPVAGDELQSGLAKLAEADLVYVRGIPPEATYMFKHALIRDAAYEALLKGRRKQLHLQVARTIDEKFPALKETHPEVLAQHWSEAGATDLAIAEWSRAGKKAETYNAFEEALESYQKALTLLNRLPESVERNKRELELRRRFVRILFIAKGYSDPQTLEAVERAIKLAEKAGDLTQSFNLLIASGIGTIIGGNLTDGSALADRALILAVHERSPNTLGRVYMLQTMSFFYRGDLAEAERFFKLGWEFFEHPSFQHVSGGAISAFNYGSLTAWQSGHITIARDRMSRMLASAKSGNPYEIALSIALSAGLQNRMREHQQAESAGRQALELAEKHNLLEIMANARFSVGWALAQLDHPTEGISLMRQGLTSLLESGQEGEQNGLRMSALAQAQHRAGSLNEALETIEQALHATPDIPIWRPEILRISGELRLKNGEPHLAEARFHKALALAQNMNAKVWELRTTTSLARLLSAQGRPDEARLMLAEIYNWFTEGFDMPDLKDAKTLLDELAT
jgi:class 3 adenylate cyclase/tetratricopeptide (TPR) repeat protein